MNLTKRPAFLALVFSALLMLGTSKSEAAVISVGIPTQTSLPEVVIPPDTFLLPVQILGASSLQSWQFDLLFDKTVVEVIDQFDGSSGIYGAQFAVGDLNSISFILGGFPFNFLGLVDDVAGSYPSLPAGPSGDGVLAYILFAFLNGQDNNDPGFEIVNAVISQAVPAPATIALSLGALLMLPAIRVARARAWMLPSASA